MKELNSQNKICWFSDYKNKHRSLSYIAHKSNYSCVKELNIRNKMGKKEEKEF